MIIKQIKSILMLSLLSLILFKSTLTLDKNDSEPVARKVTKTIIIDFIQSLVNFLHSYLRAKIASGITEISLDEERCLKIAFGIIRQNIKMLE